MTCQKCGFESSVSVGGRICANCAVGPLIKKHTNLLNRLHKVIKEMNSTIYPTESLAPGTIVRVINKGLAVVISVREEKDQFNNPIVVHELLYKSGKRADCNYSFIVRPTVYQGKQQDNQ